MKNQERLVIVINQSQIVLSLRSRNLDSILKEALLQNYLQSFKNARNTPYVVGRM